MIAPNQSGEAVGYYYVDDGATFGYTKSEFSVIKYSFKNMTLTSQVTHNGYKTAGGYYNKIILLGIHQKPKNVKVSLNKGDIPLEIEILDFDENLSALFVILFNGKAKLLDEFTMNIEL